MTAPPGSAPPGGAFPDPLAQPVVAELRHELRTPINLVIGYCEMLLEDAGDDALAPRREALDGALDAVRDALALVSRALPPSEQRVPRDRIVALAESLREPQGRILAAVDRLLATAPGDPALAGDADKVRRAAEQLLAVLGDYVPPPAPAAAPAEASAAAEGQATILVVDDIADNRTLLERRLRREGHAVLCAADGRRALELLATTRVDLVLLDVMMPELDGVAVLTHMKADPALRELPVVMISALDDVQSVAECIEKGADDYLPKPFDPVLLRARVSALLDRKALRDQELSYLRQVDRLVRAAAAIEEGTYVPGALSEVTRRGDELGRLARVLDGMAVRVRSREDRLHAQIRQLEAEIELAAATDPSTADPDATEAGPLPVGELFAGRYEVRALVGRGGMGTVYLADDRELGEPVAIKTLDRALVASDATALERFKSEIRLARRISHRNVVRTHDLGAHDGVHYVTMEYVRGITLRELMDTRGRLAVDAAIAIGVQLARALAVAHEQGVIHRDVKPQNLMLDPHGALKVMDFGIARLAERTSTLTRVGMVIGTPTYMSPEQLLDEPLDARSDLYAAGVVLFEALAGRPPYTASSVMGLVARMLSDAPPPLASVNPAVTPPLADVIHRLLARDPAERPASAGEVAERLGALA